MIKRSLFSLGAALLLVLTGSCSPQPTPESAPAEANLPNPASVFCTEQGFELEIITAEDGSQSGLCKFPDGSSCDEWAYFRGECGPTVPAEEQSGSAESTPAVSVPTPDPADYQGWWTYSNLTYNFSLLLPEDWIAEEISSSDPLSGHLVYFHPRDSVDQKSIRMTFRLKGEDTLLWPTGVGQGEFVPQGTLEIGGEPALRYLLICPTGETTSIWYHQSEESANIVRGDLEFGFMYRAHPNHCEPGFTLGGKEQLVGEMIIASLEVQ